MTGQALSFRIARLLGIPSCLAAVICLVSFVPALAQAETPTLKGGVSDQQYLPSNSSGSSYPAPQMVAPQTPTYQPPPPRKQLHGGANTSSPPVLQSGAATQVTLPPAFMGVWNVQGRRQKVEALPEFQEGAERAFSVSNQQIWTIQADQSGGYLLGSNTGIQTPLYVDKVVGTTAYLRYQHPVGKTMAQEAIVMSLAGGGAQFNGLERISIVKEGLPQPRAKVTYQLIGNRQR
jgi:hypothetical protein